MCGIVGIINADNHKSSVCVNVFKDFLFLDTYRGDDSTGVYLVPKNTYNNTPVLMKKVMPGYDFVNYRPFYNAVDDTNYKLYLGHNRLATRGGVSVGNAHPFELYDSKQDRTITLVHNGTVYNKHELRNGSTFDTDSEAICNSILLDGVEETVEKLDGAFALVWYDDKDGTVNFLRNDKRPFGFIYNKGQKRIFFGSDTTLIMPAISKNHVFGDLKIEQLPVGKWIKYDCNNVEEPLDVKEVKFRAEKVYNNTAYKGRSHSSTYHYGGNTYDAKSGQYLPATTRDTDTKTDTKDGEKGTSKGKETIHEKEANKIYREMSNKFVKFMFIDSKRIEGTKTPTYEIQGLMEHDPWLPVVAVVKQSDFFRWRTDDILKGKVVGYRTGKGLGKDPVTLFLTGIELVSVGKFDVKKNQKEDQTNKVKSFRGPNGKILNHKEWDEATKHGCANCTANIDSDIDLSWTPNGDPVCSECVKKYMHGMH